MCISGISRYIKKDGQTANERQNNIETGDYINLLLLKIAYEIA